jgi:hypothetical protein
MTSVNAGALREAPLTSCPLFIVQRKDANVSNKDL